VAFGVAPAHRLGQAAFGDEGAHLVEQGGRVAGEVAQHQVALPALRRCSRSMKR
jgi:hypothetical protein